MDGAIDNQGGTRQVTAYQEFGRGRLVQRYLNLLEAALTGMLIEDARTIGGRRASSSIRTDAFWEGTGRHSPAQ